MSKKFWSEKEDDFVKSHYLAPNWSVSRIASSIGRTRDAVSIRAGRIGLAKNNEWRPDEITELKSNYGKIKTREIAKKLGRTFTAVNHEAKVLGLVHTHTLRFDSTQHGYFKKINSPIKAYLLGLIAADGCVTDRGVVQLKVHNKDIELIKLFRDELVPSAKIANVSYEKYYKNKKHDQARCWVTSPSMCADLKRHGITPRKSLTLSWPKHLRAKFERYFILGYFDGDGSCGAYSHTLSWSVLGTRKFLLRLGESIFRHTGIKINGPRQAGENYWRSLLYRKTDVIKLDAWLHKEDCLFGLQRKQLVFKIKETEAKAAKAA